MQLSVGVSPCGACATPENVENVALKGLCRGFLTSL